jgi:hypothetical protein
MQKGVRDMQRFNMEARKYRGVIPLITTSSLKQSAFQNPDNPFLNFGRMMEASPGGNIWHRHIAFTSSFSFASLRKLLLPTAIL